MLFLPEWEMGEQEVEMEDFKSITALIFIKILVSSTEGAGHIIRP
jgi:hypothetical protein